MICGGMALRYVSNSEFYKKMRRLIIERIISRKRMERGT